MFLHMTVEQMTAIKLSYLLSLSILSNCQQYTSLLK